MRLPWRREKALSATPAVLEALRDLRISPYPPLGGSNINPQIAAAWQRGISATYGWMYATQPAVRSVIDFIARNASQISPPKLYERIDDNERERRSDHPAAQLLAYPDGRTPGDSWFFRVFTDFLIWDNAFILKFKPKSSGELVLLRIPPGGVTVGGGRFTPQSYYIWDQYGKAYPVSPENIIHWFGYHPEDPLTGLSKLETLRQELATDSAVQSATAELAKTGWKGGYIERPVEAPLADQDDLDRIAEMWKASKLRGDPILDEGMKFVQSGMTVKDAESVATRKFTTEQVCVQYGVPLAAMGMSDGDPDSARKLVYADVIPPYVGPLACLLNIGLLQEEYGEDDYYFEFNMDEKLRGDITERAAQYTSAAGAPWITRNEIRAKENLPPIEGADDLIKPLNVTEEGAEEDQYGGQQQGQPPRLPAPNVMPIQQPDKVPQDGSYRNRPKSVLDGSEGELVEIIDRFWDRQERRVLSAKSTEVVKADHSERELADDIRAVFGEGVDADRVAAGIGSLTVKALDGMPTREAFEQLRKDAKRWAADIDRARVLLVAASLADDASQEG